ncbi:MAG: prevent-host-death protein [Gemmatimonadota bacterium]
MNRISKSRLKARMLEVFRDLEEQGGELIVTDRGTPVLRVLPIRHGLSVSDAFAGLRGRVVWHGDLDRPATGEGTAA